MAALRVLPTLGLFAVLTAPFSFTHLSIATDRTPVLQRTRTPVLPDSIIEPEPASTPFPVLTPTPIITPTPVPNPTPVPTLTNPELSIPVLEQVVYEQVNQHRVQMGLPPLHLDSRLNAKARAHSQAMALKQIPFGHVDFRQRVLQINRLIPSRRISENVAYIFTHKDTATRAVQGWLRSPHHRPSIEGNYSLTGVGVAQGERGAFYFTQLYVRTR